MTRRASLLALGAAGLSTAISPLAANGKKKKKKVDVNKLCKPQADQCEAAFTNLCNGNAECLAGIRCCEPLSTCDFTGFAICVNARSN